MNKFCVVAGWPIRFVLFIALAPFVVLFGMVAGGGIEYDLNAMWCWVKGVDYDKAQ